MKLNDSESEDIMREPTAGRRLQGFVRPDSGGYRAESATRQPCKTTGRNGGYLNGWREGSVQSADAKSMKQYRHRSEVKGNKRQPYYQKEAAKKLNWRHHLCWVFLALDGNNIPSDEVGCALAEFVQPVRCR